MKDADVREALVLVENSDKKPADIDEEIKGVVGWEKITWTCISGWRFCFVGLPGEIPPPFGL